MLLPCERLRIIRPSGQPVRCCVRPRGRAHPLRYVRTDWQSAVSSIANRHPQNRVRGDQRVARGKRGTSALPGNTCRRFIPLSSVSEERGKGERRSPHAAENKQLLNNLRSGAPPASAYFRSTPFPPAAHFPFPCAALQVLQRFILVCLRLRLSGSHRARGQSP